jgi:hypothetical protein
VARSFGTERFFLSGEKNITTRRPVSADGSAPNQFAMRPWPRSGRAAHEVRLDPGGLGEFSEATESDLVFARFD